MSLLQKTISKIKWDTYSRTFIFKDKTGTVINLTGSVVKFSVKKSLSDNDFILQNTLTIDPLNGKATLASAMSMNAWMYVYDFEWTKSNWDKETFEIGKLTISNWVS